MSNEKLKRVTSNRIAEKIRGDIGDGGFLKRESLDRVDVFFLEYEYPTLWSNWGCTSLRSPAEIRATKKLLEALDACAAGTDMPSYEISPWATKLLELAAAQQGAAVACAIAEEAYDKEYKEYEKARVARNEARELVQQRSRELRAATTALAILKAAT
jgi:hypothetical protein